MAAAGSEAASLVHSRSGEPPSWPLFVAAWLLMLGGAPLPEEYHWFPVWVVLAAAVYGSYSAIRQRVPTRTYWYVLIGVMFVVLPTPRDQWQLLHLVGAVIFAVGAFVQRNSVTGQPFL